MRNEIILLVCILFLPFASAATITSATIGNDQIVISGSGFGTKVPAEPLVWDDMESWVDGMIPRDQMSSIGTWDFGDTYSGFATVTNNIAYDGSKSAWMRFKLAEPGVGGSSNSLQKKSGQYTNIYMDYKLYYPKRNGAPGNFKWWRTYGSNLIGFSAWGCVEGKILSWNFGSGSETIYGGKSWNENFYDSWSHSQVLIKAEPSPVSQSRAIVYMNGGSPEFDETRTISAYNYAYEINFMQYFAIDSRFDCYSPADPELFLDNAYLDLTWKRVEIGDAPIYENSIHREIQIPRLWSDGSITVDLNLGSYSQEEINAGLYLFVIDENNVPSSGFLLDFSGADLSSESLPVCGNLVCEPGEKNLNCPQDCGDPGICGNGIVEPDETCDPNHQMLVDCTDFEQYVAGSGDVSFTGGRLVCNACVKYSREFCDYSGVLVNPIPSSPVITNINDYFVDDKVLRVTGLNFGNDFVSLELCDSSSKPATCVLQSIIRSEQVQPEDLYGGSLEQSVTEFVASHGSFVESDFDNGLYLIITTSGGVTPGFRVTKPAVFPLQSNPTPGIPYVSSVSVLTDGDLATINGFDFGIKSPVEPWIYDDFESGSLGVDVISDPKWSTVHNSPYYSDDWANSGSKSAKIDSHLGFIDIFPTDKRDTDVLYMSGWVKTENWDSSDWRDFCGALKFWRMNNDWYGAPPEYNGPLAHNFGYSAMCQNDDFSAPGSLKVTYQRATDDLGGQVAGEESGYTTFNWNSDPVRFEFYTKLSTPGLSDGFIVARHIGLDETILNNVMQRALGVTMQLNVPFFSFGVANSAPTAEMYTWGDDLYADTTFARVELANNPDFYAATHRELQIPRNTWNEGQIQFEVNLGSFTQQDIDNGLYLFVVDESGQVSNGKLISFSGVSPPLCNNDGLCVPPEDSNNCPSDCSSPIECGDGVVEGDEVCEPSLPLSDSCVSLNQGFVGGTLSCDPLSCYYDTSGCVLPVCGNGVIEGSEVCEPSLPVSDSCVSLGFDDGVLSCDQNTCSYDVSSCVSSELIIDDGDVGTSFTGSWSSLGAGQSWSTTYNDDHHMSAPGAGNTYSWTTSLPGGVYEVSAWWFQYSVRPTNIFYDVVSDLGSFSVGPFSQKVGGNQWNLLGTFNISGQTTVTVNSGSDGSSGTVADAIRFVKVGNLNVGEPTYDFDTDGDIDLDDLYVLVQYFRLSYNQGDYDNDGIITIKDLVTHIKNWN